MDKSEVRQIILYIIIITPYRPVITIIISDVDNRSVLVHGVHNEVISIYYTRRMLCIMGRA